MLQLETYGCGAVSSFAASGSVLAFIVVMRMFTMLSMHKLIAIMSPSFGGLNNGYKIVFPNSVEKLSSPFSLGDYLVGCLSSIRGFRDFRIPWSVQLPSMKKSIKLTPPKKFELP